jgi:hypothetical protein
LRIRRAHPDAPGDDTLPLSAVSFVVRQRKLGLIEHDPERVRIAEQFPSERAGFFVSDVVGEPPAVLA